MFFVFCSGFLVAVTALLLWMNHLIFADGSTTMQGTYLALNALALMLLWYGNFLHHQMMTLSQTPFDWDSFYRLGFFLGAPCLVNTLTMLRLLIKR